LSRDTHRGPIRHRPGLSPRRRAVGRRPPDIGLRAAPHDGRRPRPPDTATGLPSLRARQLHVHPLSCAHAQAVFYCKAHLNHVPQRQEFPGREGDRDRGARHQQDAACARVPGAARRRHAVPGLRQHPQPGVQDAPAAQEQARSDRADAGTAKPESSARAGQGPASRLRLRQAGYEAL